MKIKNESLFQYGLISNLQKKYSKIKENYQSLFQYGLISNSMSSLVCVGIFVSLFQYGLISNTLSTAAVARAAWYMSLFQYGLISNKSILP